jgi:gluconolactonase
MQPEISTDTFSIFATGLDHPECCAFDRKGYLWAGGEAGQIYRIDEGGQVEEILCLDAFCAGIAFSPDDELFVCTKKLGIVRVQADGTWSVFADAAAGIRLNEPNFPVFDSKGYLYVSDSGDWKEDNGRLVRFFKNGTGVNLATGFGYANGLALSADGAHIFMVESDHDRVHRIELLNGGERIGQIEEYVSGLHHLPDGLSLDLSGNLYVTCYGSHSIYRVDRDRRPHLLARDPNGILLGGPTNLVFGGPSRQEIFVANLNRWTITRAHVGHQGQVPANLLDTWQMTL